MTELKAAMAAAAALAKLTDGLYFDDESGSLIDGNAALELARRTANEN